MRASNVLVILLAVVTGCATPRALPPSSPKTSPPSNDPATTVASVVQRVNLPYTFVRHGVEIRVDSVEQSDNNVLVNLALRETRGQMLDFRLSNLLQVIVSADRSLPYVGKPTIHLTGHDEPAVALVYQAPSAPADPSADTIELHFPTGKYWSSQTSK